MMYEKKMVVAIKANGKVLREFDDTVFVPFGSEYSILLKNLNTVRALATITIDGVDVCPGGLVIDDGKEVDLERFVTNGNMRIGNRFKFIERSEAVEAHRGVKMDDGIICVKFKFEKPKPVYISPNSPFYDWSKKQYWNGGSGGPLGGNPWDVKVYGSATMDSSDTLQTKSINSVLRNSTLNTTGIGGSLAQSSTQSYAAANNVGITAPGSVSNQSFTNVFMGAMEDESHVIVIRMLGQSPEGVEVKQPVTVKAKPTCVTCGRVNKATSKFCSQCGTSLVIV